MALSSGMREGTETAAICASVDIAPGVSIDFQLAKSSANSRSPVAAPCAPAALEICVVAAVSLASAGLVSAKAANAPRPNLRNMRPVFPSIAAAGAAVCYVADLFSTGPKRLSMRWSEPPAVSLVGVVRGNRLTRQHQRRIRATDRLQDALSR